MGYRTLRQCLNDLESHGRLVRLSDEVDARLEAAEIQRRVYERGGPAVLFDNVRGCRFPMASNLFGTLERARFIFRDTFERVRSLIEMKVDPGLALKRPSQWLSAGWTAWSMLPRKRSRGPILKHAINVDEMPQLQCWPDDGGAFVTLPQVYTEHVDRPGLAGSNLGMYRVQISGGRYKPNQEVGLHYQIHRGIGVHHQAALGRGEPFRVNVFVGGAPAMTVAAVMPLPEGMSELGFAGALAGHRIPMIPRQGEPAVYAEADFCISGVVNSERRLPEGPFGDHLGYYSLAHDFPVLDVDRVLHREDAVWPFTVVGRPPQEDTTFGELIHELTGPVIPTLIPGLKGVHAVDAAGVHPLMLALGSERYTPYEETRAPQELLTQANAILGQGQMSLAKYLWIAAHDDDPALDIQDIAAFFQHMLARVDWRRDLHFQTRTTIDTLDYSGSGLNEGSKVVVAAVGPPRRQLPTEWGGGSLPEAFGDPRLAMPGVVVIRGPAHDAEPRRPDAAISRFCQQIDPDGELRRFPLTVIVDDSAFATKSLRNWLWVTFTRSDPAADIHGVDEFIDQKHWGCDSTLVIDARLKPHHAPPLIEDPEVVKKIDALAARGGPLATYL